MPRLTGLPYKLERIQLRMTEDARERLNRVAGISSLSPHAMGSIALAVGLNVIEQSFMARVEGIDIEEVAEALSLGVHEDLTQLEQALDVAPQGSEE